MYVLYLIDCEMEEVGFRPPPGPQSKQGQNEFESVPEAGLPTLMLFPCVTVLHQLDCS